MPPEARGEAVVLVPAGDDVKMAVPTPAPLVHTWSAAVVVGSGVHVPLADVERCEHVHVDLCEADISCDAVLCWMTDEYVVLGEAVCPSCETGLLSCDGQVLGCDACYEEYDLITGASISGHSVPLGTARVSLEVKGETMAFATDDVLNAIEAGLNMESTFSSAEPATEEAVEAEVPDQPQRDLPSCC